MWTFQTLSFDLGCMRINTGAARPHCQTSPKPRQFKTHIHTTPPTFHQSGHLNTQTRLCTYIQRVTNADSKKNQKKLRCTRVSVFPTLSHCTAPPAVTVLYSTRFHKLAENFRICSHTRRRPMTMVPLIELPPSYNSLSLKRELESDI